MENDIFRMNPNKVENTSTYTRYTVFGEHDDIDSDGNPLTDQEKDCLAYIKNLNGDQQYYLKIGLHGKIFNPIGLYSEGKSNKFLSKVGKQEYNFTKVNSKVFNMYLNFLRTKNLAWLNNAERELT
jgi:hypothetical protein